MFTSRSVGIGLTIAIAITIGFVQTAAAQRKQLTYEQAWKRCMSVARDAAGIGDQNTRFHRGAACMKKLGHNI